MTKTISKLILSLLIVAGTASAANLFCTLFGIGCPSAAPPFVPTYETVTLSDGFGHTYPLNSWYFATAETANTVCLKLRCMFVVSQLCSMGGGPAECSALERMLVFPGLKVNAGLMASYWTRNPEDKFPGVAQKLADMELVNRRNAP